MVPGPAESAWGCQEAQRPGGRLSSKAGVLFLYPCPPPTEPALLRVPPTGPQQRPCAPPPWWRPAARAGWPAPAASSPVSALAAAPGGSARCARSRDTCASPEPPGSGGHGPHVGAGRSGRDSWQRRRDLGLGTRSAPTGSAMTFSGVPLLGGVRVPPVTLRPWCSSSAPASLARPSRRPGRWSFGSTAEPWQQLCRGPRLSESPQLGPPATLHGPLLPCDLRQEDPSPWGCRTASRPSQLGCDGLWRGPGPPLQGQ